MCHNWGLIIIEEQYPLVVNWGLYNFFFILCFTVTYSLSLPLKVIWVASLVFCLNKKP